MEVVTIAITAVIATVVGIGPVVVGMLRSHERNVLRQR